MARAATAQELIYFRSSPQYTSIRAAIISMPAMFKSRVNKATWTTRDGIAEIPYDTVTLGAYPDLKIGSTLYIGSQDGLADLGQVRIRQAADATKIYINETSEINWADNIYLTGTLNFDLWQKALRVVSEVYYMDYDDAYNNQNQVWKPVAIMGPNRVVKLSGATIATTWSGSESWVPDSTISAYAWTATGASATSGMTSATPTITYNAAGTYVVQMTVTAANGKTATGYRYVVVRSATEPASNIELKNLRGNWETGGWDFGIKMYTGADTTTVRDRALCILYSDDTYGSTQINIGPVAGVESILAIGWIKGETINRNPNGGWVEFEAAGPQAWLDQETNFPLGIQNVTSTPTMWTEVKNLTIDKIINHYANQRSTAGAICDVYPTNDTRVAPGLMAALGTLWQQLTTITERTILAHPACNRYGQIYTQIDSQYITSANRTTIPTVMAITKADTVEDIEIERVTVPPVSRIEVSGITVKAGTTTPATFYAIAPGHGYKHYGTSDNIDRLLVTGQAQVINLAGLLLGWKNNPYPRFDIKLRTLNKLIDIAPRQYMNLTVAAGDTPRGIDYDGKIIVREIEHSTQSGAMLTTITAEAETFQDLSMIGDRPPDGPPLTPPNPPEVPIIPPVPPIPPFPQDPTVVLPKGLVAMLLPSKGIWLLDTTKTTPQWRPQTPLGTWDQTDLDSLVYLDFFRVSGRIVTGSLTQVWSFLRDTNTADLIGPAAVMLARKGTGYSTIVGIGINPNIDNQVAAMVGGITANSSLSWTSLFRGNFGTGDLTETYYDPSGARPYDPGRLTYYNSNWIAVSSNYYTTGSSWNFNFLLTVKSTGPIAAGYVAAQSLVQAMSADVAYWTTASSQYKLTNLGTTRTTLTLGTVPQDGGLDCDPTGQHLISIANMSSAIGISHDFGATATSIPYSSFHSMSYDGRTPIDINSTKVLNMGSATNWLVAFRGTVYLDPGIPTANYLHVQTTTDSGATWVDASGNLLELVGDETAMVTAMRYA